MPRPYKPRNRPSPDSAVLQGGPGDEGEWDSEVHIDDDDTYEDPRPSPPNDPMAALTARMNALEAENANLRRAIPPAVPAPTAPASDPYDDIDWETELYSNPKEALKKYGKIVKDEVSRDLTSKYQQERGQSKFWEDFYKDHKDLKDDHFLVQSTLSANMAALANVPVADAMNKLADLTRQNIMRYSQKGAGRKARVEGNDPPQPRPQPREEPTVVTLGDILRSRREARRKGQAA